MSGISQRTPKPFVKPLPVNQLRRLLQENTSVVSLVFLGLLFGFMAVYLLSLSIRMTDTDLWYHLAGGRHLLATGELYSPLVNSYLDIERNFTNYFWGFQAAVYISWLGGGEFALILLKTALFLASAWFVTKIILDGKPAREASFLQLMVIAIFIAILCCRGLSLRPHLISYMMIPAFIYILAYRSKWYPALPVLTIVWVNFHGVEWVVGALICGSYFLQHLVDYVRSPQIQRDRQPMMWIALCLPAMLVNPNHLYLVTAPFAHDSGLNDFIGELGDVALTAAISFSDGLTLNTLILGLMFFIVVGAGTAFSDIRRHMPPLLLAAGALALFVMAKRFTWEWALLSAPLIAVGLREWRGPETGLRAVAALMAFLLLMPFTFWPAMRTGIEHYPFDKHSLPWGTTMFIKENNLQGKYLIAPSFAGYAEFELAPGVTIHMDMQFPPFNSLDFHEYIAAMLTPEGLAHYIDKYHPDMLGVRTGNKVFPDTKARELGYAPVFFDEKVVLYVERNRFPDIASRYEINAVNPFNPDQFRRDKVENAIGEMEAIISAVSMPDLRLSLIGLLIEQGNLNKAQLYIDEAEKEQPGTVTTSYFAGRIAHLQSDCAAAVTHYEVAIPLTDDNQPIHGYAAECYFVNGNPGQAYEHFKQAIDPYKDTSPDTLAYYQFALSAVAVGANDEAGRLLRMIGRFDPDSSMMPQVESLLAEIEHK
jgi:tetratricopeptide (TPR) repeat protein